MKREPYNELQKMQFLMERMDKHYTMREIDAINEERSNVYTVDGIARELNTPEDLLTALSKGGISPQNGWFVTMGYISGIIALEGKTPKTKIEKFSDDAVAYGRSINNQRINSIIDNPTLNKKGEITNPYQPDSYTNFIVQANICKLMYGRNQEYAGQKQRVIDRMKQYYQDNPEKRDQYAAAKNLMSPEDQVFDDARNDNYEKVPNTNVYKYGPDGSYEMRFNTPKAVYKKLKTVYFLIKNEDEIEEITPEEVKAYVGLFGSSAEKKIKIEEPIVQEVDGIIKKVKEEEFNGDIWGKQKLDSIFLLNFSEKQDNNVKLHYYNPDAIVRFVKGRVLKSGEIPSRFTNKGVFRSGIEKMVNSTEE